jgi:enoyl-CoA hydratase
MAQDVELSMHGEVAMIQLRRPFRGNALRGTMFDQLRKITLKLADSPPAYVVITGEGQDFCVGLERDPEDPLYRSLEPIVRARDAFRVQELLTSMRSPFDGLSRLPCPVLCAIEGRCHGAGLELALATDLRICGESASLRFEDAAWGLLTGLGGLTRAMQLLGPSVALDHLLTTRPIPVDEGLQLGLVSRVSPSGGSLSAALEVVHDLRRASPIARTQALLAMRAIQSKALPEMLQHEVQAAARTWIGSDWPAALKAAKEGREPTW